MGANLAYVDESGQYFLFGHLYDMKSQRDLTAERKDTWRAIDFDTLPLSDAMKDVRGNGARVLAIFSDPDCPYCQKLESDIRSLTNVTIYTFLMPLVSLHPAAHSKAVSVWCATDRTAAWHAMMWRGESVPQADCPHPVDRNVALGERLGINGTPTLISVDGRMLPGAASKEQIEAWLQRVGSQRPRRHQPQRSHRDEPRRDEPEHADRDHGPGGGDDDRPGRLRLLAVRRRGHGELCLQGARRRPVHVHLWRLRQRQRQCHLPFQCQCQCQCQSQHRRQPIC